MVIRQQTQKRQRRGAPWTEAEDQRLLAIANLPPRAIADTMRRSWLAYRRRLVYLRRTARLTCTGSGVPKQDERRPPRSERQMYKESGGHPAFFVACSG